MTDALFRPFDIKKWFVLGFSAFLAGLGARGGSGANSSIGNQVDVDDLGQSAGELWQNVVANGLLFALGAFGCAVLLIVAFAVLWVSSRGKFMFLDNVVHNRALVVDPWKRFRKQGNSLFLFRVLFCLACIFLILGLALLIAATVGFSAWSELETASSIALIFAAFGSLVLLILVIVYAAFFLDAFVVPLMHRYNLGAVAGWSRFLNIFRQHPWAFLLSGLLVIVFGIGVLMLILGFGLMTCCLGFLLLMIPYIGSVVTLPISVFYRSFTFEFLAQFDAGLLPESTPEDSPPESPRPPPLAEATV